MKLAALIPARLSSHRLPGKALKDIAGLPMVVRVGRTAEEAGIFDRVAVATDSREIADACTDWGIEAIMTSPEHLNPTSRVCEAIRGIEADYYVMIGGDEPMLTAEQIRGFVTEGAGHMGEAFVVNACEPIPDSAEAEDPANIKIVRDLAGYGMYASRNLIPASRSMMHEKFVSIGIYSADALWFYEDTPQTPLELEERFDLLRFMEHGKKIFFVSINGYTLSVDTREDYEKVCRLMREKGGPI